MKKKESQWRLQKDLIGLMIWRVEASSSWSRLWIKLEVILLKLVYGLVIFLVKERQHSLMACSTSCKNSIIVEDRRFFFENWMYLDRIESECDYWCSVWRWFPSDCFNWNEGVGCTCRQYDAQVSILVRKRG